MTEAANPVANPEPLADQRRNLKRRASDRVLRVSVETLAQHEAGHAVMRWLRGLLPGTLTIDETGGLCYGDPGKRVDLESLLMVCLAGYAAEFGYPCAAPPDLGQWHDSDLATAREILAHNTWLRLSIITSSPAGADTLVQSVDDALGRHFLRAGELLSPHAHVVQAVAQRLARERQLSAPVVAATIQAAANPIEESPSR